MLLVIQILTQSLCKTRRWSDVLNACVDNGADCIQLREKELDAGPLMELTALTVAICRPSGVTVIVNDRPDVALAAGADGVHLAPSHTSVSPTVSALLSTERCQIAVTSVAP